MIVSDQAVRCARIRERKFARWIDVSEQDFGNGLTAFIARVVRHQDRAGFVNDTIDNSGPPFNKDDHDRFPRCFDSFCQALLRFAKI